jgi:hypothetical protein
VWWSEIGGAKIQGDIMIQVFLITPPLPIVDDVLVVVVVVLFSE